MSLVKGAVIVAIWGSVAFTVTHVQYLDTQFLEVGFVAFVGFVTAMVGTLIVSEAK